VKAAAAAGLMLLARTAPADVYFNHGGKPGGQPSDSGYHFEDQGRFFATTDYGFSPGSEDQLSGTLLGFIWDKSCPYVRGQNPTTVSQLGRSFYGKPWLSDGGDCVFGLTFEKPFASPWWRDARHDPDQQFAQFPGKIPLFDRAVIHWSRLTPKPGTWGACLLDADGNLKRLEVDNQQTLYPYDQTVLNFPPTTVKRLYFGVRGGTLRDNFVEIRDLALLLHSRPRIDERLLVSQPDAYQAEYSLTRPGEIERLILCNYYWKAPWDAVILRSLAPFVELGGKRLQAIGASPVETARVGRADILRYQLDFGPGGKVGVTTTFSDELKGTVKFVCEAADLPGGAKLGFAMAGDLPLFASCVDNAAPTVLAPRVYQTPAGPVGFALSGASDLAASRQADRVAFSVVADGSKLDLTLSLPIGPLAGIQPGMINFAWRPSLADQGDEGVAPFSMDDLEPLEIVNLGDPNDPHVVYDLTNDPLIAKWRKSGEAKLPGSYGKLNFINDPEKAKVPIARVLGQPCRDLGTNETTYFRFNLQTRLEPRTPYLLVVEHAFDKERRGEFHSVGVNRDGSDWRSLNRCPSPFGGFDTGKGPQPGRFKKESIFLFEPGANAYPLDTTISLCFSSSSLSGYFLESGKNNPPGLAVKSVTLYRVPRLPALPDLAPLLPPGGRRRGVSMESENFSPWMLEQFPRLYGYDGLWTHRQPSAQFLYGGGYPVPYPGWRTWCHAGSLEANRWLYAKAAKEGVAVKTCLGWLIDLGFEDTPHDSFLGLGWLAGPTWGSVPLSPTKAELNHLGRALDRSLSALAQCPSLADISLGDIPSFSKRDLDDFSRETGVAFASSPAPLENLKRLLDAPQATVDAWTQWACRKRYAFLSWLLDKVRSHRSGLYLTLNQGWYANGMQGMWYGNQWPFAITGLKARGIDSYVKFLKFVGYDPALYAKGDGFAFGMEMYSPSIMSNGDGKGVWPFDGSGPAVRDGFGGGLSVSSCFFDESPKSLQSWGCNYVRSQRDFRKEFVSAVVDGNAREYILQSYYFDSARGRLADLRELAVPFRLLPFAKPAPFAGTLADSAKQAVINQYGDRQGLFNPGDQPTDVTLTLPEGADTVADLSNGVRQHLVVANRRVTLHMEPWSLKTLEIK
jgi:hypothetical protein